MRLTIAARGYPTGMLFGRRWSCVCLVLLGGCLQARAVVVRGVVTTPLGVPIPGARVQLILGQRSVADTISGLDGSYEIRTDLSGRFVLLSSAYVLARPAVEISPEFYGGRVDAVRMDLALLPRTLTPPMTALQTGRPTTLETLAAAATQVVASRLLTRQTVADVLSEQMPSAFVVRQGQTGTPATMYVRGAGPEAAGLELNGVDAGRAGGGFNVETLATAGLAVAGSEPALELSAGANPLYGSHAEAAVLSLHGARAAGDGLHLTYAGDAGPLDTERQEAVAAYTRRRLDALGEYVRFDTANSVPASPFHEASVDAGVGYQVTANTGLRVELRRDVAASALPSPFAFYGLAPAGRLAEQNLIGDAAYETRTARDWHTLLRYGLVRERQQTFDYATPANGLTETIAGANGYTATGSAAFLPLPAREDRVSDRDEFTLESDYAFRPYLQALIGARYEEERAADLLPAGVGALHGSLRGEQTQLAFTGAVQGDIRHRVFYQASGLVDFGNDAVDAAAGPANTFGLRGAPSLGLSWAPTRPGRRRLSGTTLHLAAATGFRDRSLAERTASPAADGLPRSRTFATGISQNLLREKLTLRATYFHGQYAHQTELLTPETVGAAAALSDQLAYRAQGLETTLRYAPTGRFHVEGGYTYLAALVERSAETPVVNPGLPGVAIGPSSALQGQRPFDRPPESGFASAEYAAKTVTATVSAAFAGRSDETTGLVLNPRLLLPNRNLSPGYTRVDASFDYRVNRRVTVYTQLDNLFDSRHLAPVGYLSTPFLARTGLRIRFGGGL